MKGEINMKLIEMDKQQLRQVAKQRVKNKLENNLINLNRLRSLVFYVLR